MTTIAELARGGSVAIHHSSARVGSGDQPVLTADDLTGGGQPTGWAEPGPGLVMIEPGDVVATPTGTVRVVQEIGWALGPQLTLYRVDPARLDADFLAGFLRAGSSLSRGASRLDARRTKVPRLSWPNSANTGWPSAAWPTSTPPSTRRRGGARSSSGSRWTVWPPGHLR